MDSRPGLSCEPHSLLIKAAAYQREYPNAAVSGDCPLKGKGFIAIAKSKLNDLLVQRLVDARGVPGWDVRDSILKMSENMKTAACHWGFTGHCLSNYTRFHFGCFFLIRFLCFPTYGRDKKKKAFIMGVE